MTDSDNVESDETYGDIMEPVREAAEELLQEEQEVVMEPVNGKFGSLREAEVPEPEPEPEAPEPVDFGLTEPVQESEEDESNVPHVYSAQDVAEVPKPLRQGMQFFAAGSRRTQGLKETKSEPRVNRYTSKVYPGQELAPPTRTTFK